jgi:hypothetical protein
VGRIARTAEAAGVNVFRRFDLMRYWVVHDGLSIEDVVRQGDQLRLHMSEFATNCVITALFQSIRERVEAEGVT